MTLLSFKDQEKQIKRWCIFSATAAKRNTFCDGRVSPKNVLLPVCFWRREFDRAPQIDSAFKTGRQVKQHPDRPFFLSSPSRTATNSHPQSSLYAKHSKSISRSDGFLNYENSLRDVVGISNLDMLLIFFSLLWDW